MSAHANTSQMVRVAAETAETLVCDVFHHAGCSRAEAERIANRLTGANLRGHDSHGIIRTGRYLEWLRSGKVIADQTIAIEQESDVLVVADGKYGFGQSVGEQIVDIGIAKARSHGVCVTALKHAGHLGRIGDWAERAAAAQLVSIHMVNVRGSLLVAPFGGVDRRGSTSPFCAGIPMGDEPPIVLDFATSQVAEGKALVALRGGAPLPRDSLVLPDGTLSVDPRALYGELEPGRFPDPTRGPGALCGFGLHKGSGLNFLMEIMGGVLTGSGTCDVGAGTSERRVCNGMLSIFLNMHAFRSEDEFIADVRRYVDFVKSSRPIEPGGEVLVPGEKERQILAERQRLGLPLPAQTWTDIITCAQSVGIDVSQLKGVA